RQPCRPGCPWRKRNHLARRLNQSGKHSLSLAHRRPFSRHLRQQVEESSLPFTSNRPIHRRTLVAILELLPVSPVVEESPRHVLLHRGHHIVTRFVEVRVVILVEQNRLQRIPHHRPRRVNRI